MSSSWCVATSNGRNCEKHILALHTFAPISQLRLSTWCLKETFLALLFASNQIKQMLQDNMAALHT